MGDLSWDDFDIDDEDVTEEDAKDIDTGVGVPVGQYLCTVVDSTPKQIDFNAYSCLGVTLKFEVIKAIEVEGKPVSEHDVDEYKERFITDDVAFADSEGKEKPGMKKRRKYVALRLGLIQPGEKLTKSIWMNDVIGKKIKLRLEENVYTDKKTGKEKVGFPQVGFFTGYEKVDGEAKESSVSTWDDI